MHYKFDVSLILACFNEAEIFDESVKEIITVLDKTNWTYEIIFIDDKSTDKTAQLIRKIIKKYPKKHLRAYFHKKNQGRGKTVSEGFLKSNGKIIGFIDIDLEIPAWYIPRFIESINTKVDGAIAWRVYDINFKGLLRWIASKGYNRLREYSLGLTLKDTEAGYKFFKRHKIIPVVKKCQDPHWFWDTEIIARALKENLRLLELPVVFMRRSDKTSTVKLLPDALDYLFKLVKYSQNLRTTG